jgi:hypothetical protein
MTWQVPDELKFTVGAVKCMNSKLNYRLSLVSHFYRFLYCKPPPSAVLYLALELLCSVNLLSIPNSDVHGYVIQPR